MIVNVQAQIVNCDCECAGIALTLGWILTLALTPVCQRSLFTISKFLIDRTLFRYGISFSLQISKLELFGLFSDTEYPFFTISKFELVGLFSDTEYPFFYYFKFWIVWTLYRYGIPFFYHLKLCNYWTLYRYRTSFWLTISQSELLRTFFRYGISSLLTIWIGWTLFRYGVSFLMTI